MLKLAFGPHCLGERIGRIVCRPPDLDVLERDPIGGAWQGTLMRSILVALLVFGSLPLIMVKPHLGVLVWSWLGYMNPQTLTWGFAQNFPFAMVVGLVTIAAWLFSREPKTIPWHPLVLLMAAFAAWVSFTTLFAAYPDPAQAKWDRTMKVLLFNGFVTLGLITTRLRLESRKL